MHTLLNVPPLRDHPKHATYVDDVHVEGSGLVDTWTGMLETIRRFTQGGFLLNEWKL